MDPARFIEKCSVVRHATAGTRDSLEEHGLLTAYQAVHLATDLDDWRRRRIDISPRLDPVTLTLPGGAQVWLRDQGPLRSSATLSRHLIPPTTVPEWIELLNGRVYFGISVEHLLKKYSAEIPHNVLEIRGADLWELCADRIELADRNVGALPRASLPTKHPSAFRRVVDYPADRVRYIREITVVGGLSADELGELTSG